MARPYTAASLFCGAGGLDLGFHNAGFQTIWANDFNKDATDTMKRWCRDGEIKCGDVTQLSSLYIPKASIMLGGFPCFVKGTLVNTDLGLKPIEQVTTSDNVLTHKGRYKKVLTLMHDKKKGIHTIRTQGAPDIKCTDNHPFYVRTITSKTKYSHMENGKCINETVRTCSEPTWKAAKDIVKGDYVGMPINNEKMNPLHLSDEDIFLIGLFCDSGSISFDVSASKPEISSVTISVLTGLEDKVKNALEGRVYTSYKWKERTEFVITKTDSLLFTIFASCGVNKMDRCVPYPILSLPKENLKHFIDGVMFNHQSLNRGLMQFSIKNEQFICEFAGVIAKVYNQGFQLQNSESGIWRLRFKQGDTKQVHTVYKDDMIWFPVRENIYDASYSETTYNLEVEEDNSYCVYGIAVHNCQTFSSMGARKGMNDPRGVLYREYIRILKAVRPYMFIGENVLGLMTMDGGAVLEKITQDFAEAGYTIYYDLYNAADYGVAQDRKRVIIQGWRNDLKGVCIPQPVKLPPVSMRDVLWGKPEPEHSDVHWGPYSPRFMSVNRKRTWDEPSYTILAGARSCPLHPSSPAEICIADHKWQFAPESEGITRRFAWWEAAIIQSFPEDMKFCGSLESRYKQVGNAVPPKLGEAFGKVVLAELERLGLPDLSSGI